MRTLSLLPVFLLAGFGLMAQEGDRLLLQISSGYERQDFHWSIAGNSAGQDPNIYSELKWHKVSGPAMRIGLEWKPWRRWRVFANGSRVFNRTGTLSDTDYGLDNRYDPIYHAQFGVSGGYSEGVAAGIGYSLINRGRWRLTSYIGYGIDAQYFPISDPDEGLGNLNSSYSAQWRGLLLKGEVSWQLAGRWQLVGDAVYHQASYHAKADWNLIELFAQPVSFRHTADGYGVDAGAGVRYKAWRRVAIDLRGGYFDWETGTGIDRLYLNTGGSDVTQLNGVVRRGWRVLLGVGIGL